ncbi:unnamed protein product [Ectocarpus sp. 8 AP-2014]
MKVSVAVSQVAGGVLSLGWQRVVHWRGRGRICAMLCAVVHILVGGPPGVRGGGRFHRKALLRRLVGGNTSMSIEKVAFSHRCKVHFGSATSYPCFVVRVVHFSFLLHIFLLFLATDKPILESRDDHQHVSLAEITANSRLRRSCLLRVDVRVDRIAFSTTQKRQVMMTGECFLLLLNLPCLASVLAMRSVHPYCATSAFLFRLCFVADTNQLVTRTSRWYEMFWSTCLVLLHDLVAGPMISALFSGGGVLL